VFWTVKRQNTWKLLKQLDRLIIENLYVKENP